MSVHARQTAAEILIGLVVCFAAAEVLLRPARRELREQQAAIAGLMPASSATNAPDESDVLSLAEANERGRREITLRSEASRDEAALFAEIMAIADRHRVRVEHFEPGMSVPVPTPPSSVQPAERPRPDTISSYNISLSGGYAGVVRFLDELRRSAVFFNTRAVRIVPSDVDPASGVRADISVDFYGFNTPEDAPGAAPSLETKP